MATGSQTGVRPVIPPVTTVKPPKTPPAWFRIAMPSTADVIFMVLLVALTYGGLQPRLLSDAGTGWHIRTGQHILQTRTIPHQDFFSYTMPGRPWFAWEWLCDLGMGGVYDLAGLNGIVSLSALLIAAVFALVFRFALLRSGQLVVAAVLTLLAVMASSIHMLARPHLLSWLLILAFWETLERSIQVQRSKGRARRLALLPLLMLFWVNIHGGFLLGLALIAVYFTGQVWEWMTTRRNDPVKRQASRENARALAIAGGISFLTTFANPYGYKLWIHIHEYLGNRFYMDNVQEFLSPNFHGAAEKCFAALLLLALFALAANHGRTRATELLLVLFSVYIGLYAARNIPTASILLAVTVAPLLGNTIQEAGAGEGIPSSARSWFARLHHFSSRMAQTEQKLSGHVLALMLVVLSAWICLHGGWLGPNQVLHAQFNSKRFPVPAVDFLAVHCIRSHVFTPDSWGGYLIYRMYPEFKVFMDDRHDFYGENFVRDYMKVRGIQLGWEQVLDKHSVNWVLIRADSTLSNGLKETPAWKVVYDDGVAIIFTRTSPLPA
jgi:hypothetical protein